MATLSGTTLGKYQISERLGRGGMAEVYKAYHPQLERYAAIKVLHGFLAEGQDFQMRFQREAKAIAALRHPNIVQIYDIDIQDENYYMVMEYIDSGTLKERLIQASGPLPIHAMAHIFRQIASALGYAHRKGVLHRDIKPANVLLDKSGRVVLTDFGIARIVSETQFTVTGTLVGTPAYMSPEQGKGLQISTPSDIYSLGIILYEMVTGKVPFDAETPLAVIHKHINEPLPAPRTLREDIPGALENVILKALAKEADERYQTAGEMLTAAEDAFRDFEELTQSDTLVEAPDLARGEAELEQSLASKDTAAMEYEPDIPEPQETFASKSTVAMEPDADAEAELEDIADRATVAMQTEDEPEPEPQPQKPQPKPELLPKPKPKVRLLPIIISIVGVAAIVALLVWGIPELTDYWNDDWGEASADEQATSEPATEQATIEPETEQATMEPETELECASPEECHALAEEVWGNGDVEGALGIIDRAISLVPETDHPPFAQFWCMRAEALVALDRIDEAIWNFEDCQAWTEGDPNLEDLRVFAQEQIENLSGNQAAEPSGEECSIPEACFELAEMRRADGDFGAAIEWLDKAITMVSEEDMPVYHFMMCTLGDTYMQLENWEEALRSFEDCITWTHDDPGLEEARNFAQEQIDLINNR
jgi:serine/threonine protein kinase